MLLICIEDSDMGYCKGIEMIQRKGLIITFAFC
jgi:hypothetical protein